MFSCSVCLLMIQLNNHNTFSVHGWLIILINSSKCVQCCVECGVSVSIRCGLLLQEIIILIVEIRLIHLKQRNTLDGIQRKCGVSSKVIHLTVLFIFSPKKLLSTFSLIKIQSELLNFSSGSARKIEQIPYLY